MDPDTLIHIPPTWDTPLPLTDWFRPGTPLEVDIGCGKGRFLLAHASAIPAHAFIGIDRMLKRLRRVDRRLRRAGLTNVRLVRVEAAYAVEYLLPAGSVTTYYVFFPDPWPKRRHHPRRLFSPLFLDALHRTLCPTGCVHIATDFLDYHAAIKTLFEKDPRFKAIAPFEPPEEERTDFELVFRQEQRPVGRCSFQRRDA